LAYGYAISSRRSTARTNESRDLSVQPIFRLTLKGSF
jgi:hypothetical protein